MLHVRIHQGSQGRPDGDLYPLCRCREGEVDDPVLCMRPFELLCEECRVVPAITTTEWSATLHVRCGFHAQSVTL
eukprot:COSAG01_NODE_679_length_14296_cov_250.437575_4_plen_75_part_00